MRKKCFENCGINETEKYKYKNDHCIIKKIVIVGGSRNMILDNVNPNDLFPTEKKGPSVLGTIEYAIQGSTEFEGAFIATNERIIMNVDMNGEFYYRSIAYNEVEKIEYDGENIHFTFNIGPMPMKQIQKGDVEAFVQYVSDKIDQ